MAEKKGRVLIERLTDPAEWGEKATDDAYDGPLNIAGEQVDVSSLPRFGPEPDESPVDGGKAKAPLLPAGSP